MIWTIFRLPRKYIQKNSYSSCIIHPSTASFSYIKASTTSKIPSLCHSYRLKSTIAVAMSGGVDSAVSAALLQQQGHDIVGVFMKNWDKNDEYGDVMCPIEQDREDMIAVCKQLKIPYEEVEFVRDYWNDVFEPFIYAYGTGVLTPNPDVYCNRHIKFHKFRDYALNHLKVDMIATGHYVRLTHNDDDISSIPQLYCGVDINKDQSYFLSLTQGHNLRQCLFPVGNMMKYEVKAIARDKFTGLRVLDKRESTGVCFIGEREMPSFLEQYIDLHPGRFIDVDSGAIVGHHSGKETYTLGQKAKIKSQKHKYYVAKKSRDHHDIHVALGSDHPVLYSHHIITSYDNFSWIAGHPPPQLHHDHDHHHHYHHHENHDHQDHVWKLSCKVRYRDPSIACTVSIIHDKHDGMKKMRIDFDVKTFIVAPGQVVALYDEEMCLGGGIVDEDVI